MRNFIAAAALLFAAPADAANLAQWRDDVAAIVAEIRLTHPDPFTKTGELTFLRAADALGDRLPQLSEEERVVAAMRLVAMLGDGHTQLMPVGEAFDAWYPFRIYEFEDGYFVTAAERGAAAEFAGAQVLAIGGRPIDEVAAAARALSNADNALDMKERLYLASSASVMKGLGYAAEDGSLKVRARLRTGRTVERVFAARASVPDAPIAGDGFDWRFFPEMMGPPIAPFENWVSAYRGLPYASFRDADAARPAHFIRRRGSNGFALEGRDAYYIQVNGVGGFEGKSFAELFRGWLSEIEAMGPRRVIIDIRYNAGGDGSTIPAVIHEFIEREKSPPWKELYLLTGRRTFSAGVMMLDWFADHAALTIIGEPAGAHLNHYGDARSTDFAQTGLRLSVSTLRHQLSESDDRDEYTRVDIPAPFSFAEYAAGRDPAVDAILSGEEMRAIPVIATTDGAAAAKAAWESRKEKFSRYEWWRAPSEISMRRACDFHVEAGRLGEALGVCALTADMHPDDWHAWYNLGDVQEAAGDRAGAAASYRRVLDIDPRNFNRQAIEAFLAEEGA